MARSLEEQRVDGADVVGTVVGDALTALALLHVGELMVAEGYAQRALCRLNQTTLPPPFLQVALLVATMVAVARLPSTSQLAETEALVRRLRRMRGRVRSLRVASQIVVARFFLAVDDLGSARAHLARVIAGSPSHGERWHELEAHELLARVLPGHDPMAARGHLERAQALRTELLADVAAGAAVRTPPSRRPSVPGRVLGARIDLVFAEVQHHLRPHLTNRRVHFEAPAGLSTASSRSLLELLCVNLVLAMVDAANPDDELRVLAAEEPETGRIVVSFVAASGQWAGLQGAIEECRDLCRRVGGEIELDDAEGLRTMVWLPGPSSDEVGSVAILVEDRRIQRTLMDGLAQLGWSARVVLPGEVMDAHAVAAFTEPRLRHELPLHVVPIEVVARAEGWERGEQLPVPFVLTELQELLEPLQEARDSSAAAPQPS